MNKTILKVVFLVVVLAAVIGNDELVVFCRAQSLCKMTQDGLKACKPAVTQPSPAKPTADCCKALGNADIPCLCYYKNANFLPMFGIDPTLAMQLPAKCNLPPTNC